MLTVLICLAIQAGVAIGDQTVDRPLGIQHSTLAVRHAQALSAVVRVNPQSDAAFVTPRLFQGSIPTVFSCVSSRDAVAALDGTPHSERGRSPPLL